MKNNASGKFFDQYIGLRVEADGLGCLYKVEGIGEDGLGYRYFTGPKRAGATQGKFYSGVPTVRLQELERGEAKKELVIQNFHDFADAFGNCRHEGGVELRSGKKPEVLLKLIVEMTTNVDDIVLDFFCGTGTTPAVAHKLQRRFIGVEQLDYLDNDDVTRLKNVVNGDPTGISTEIDWQGGGDFIYCELMAYNEIFMERIQSAQSSEELLDIWREMSTESFLNWYVKPKKPEEAEDHFIAVGDIQKQKTCLQEMLDKNQLYVHLSEIKDHKFNVSDSDKALNEDFYRSDSNA